MDLILLDLKLPKLDGFEVCRRLKADPATATIPIVVFTGTEEYSRGLADRCVELGIAEWLKKPFRSQELLEKIQRALGPPRARPSPAAREAPPVAEKREPPPVAEKPRILLVDDEPSIVKLVGKRLEVEGYTVVVARDGQEALRMAHTDTPDLIILDLMLPKVNGYEVCTILKQDTRYRHIPIILFTAKAQAKDEQLGWECGANGYLRKPFKSQELLDQIRKLLHPSVPTT